MSKCGRERVREERKKKRKRDKFRDRGCSSARGAGRDEEGRAESTGYTCRSKTRRRDNGGTGRERGARDAKFLWRAGGEISDGRARWRVRAD